MEGEMQFYHSIQKPISKHWGISLECREAAKVQRTDLMIGYIVWVGESELQPEL